MISIAASLRELGNMLYTASALTEQTVTSILEGFLKLTEDKRNFVGDTLTLSPVGLSTIKSLTNNIRLNITNNSLDKVISIFLNAYNISDDKFKKEFSSQYNSLKEIDSNSTLDTIKSKLDVAVKFWGRLLKSRS